MPVSYTHRDVYKRQAYTSKDRDHESVGLAGTIRDNIASTGYIKNLLVGPIISFSKEKQYVEKQIADLNLKCASQYLSLIHIYPFGPAVIPEDLAHSPALLARLERCGALGQRGQAVMVERAVPRAA